MKVRLLHLQSPAGKINVTPLIDVVMVLIVFYLIVGKLATDKAARVDLPRSEVGQQQQDRGVVISVVQDSTGMVVTLEGEEVTLDALDTRLRELMPELAATGQSRPVSLRADRAFSYGEVRPVLDACRRAGVTSVKLITTRTDGGGA